MAYVAFTFKIIEKVGNADTDMCYINRHIHPLSGSQPVRLALHNSEAELRGDTALPPLSSTGTCSIDLILQFLDSTIEVVRSS